MNIKDYQYIIKLNTGSTTYELDICKYFNISTDRSNELVYADMAKYMKIEPVEIKEKEIINGYMLERDILKCTYEQWKQLELILADDDNENNLHKLIAIYFRPAIRIKKNIFSKERYEIEKFDLDKYELNSEKLLELDMNIASGLLVFFYQNVPRLLNNIKIHYLNNQNQMMNNLLNQNEKE